MKKIIAGVFVISALFACNVKKANDVLQPVLNQSDSLKNNVDSLVVDNNETSLVIEDEELFDDFIYNFASDYSLQMKRINFPLAFSNQGALSKIDKSKWEHDELFTAQNYYTLLFDREEDLDLVGDTTLTAVQVEWIYLKTQLVKKYFFVKERGTWCLDSLDISPIKNKNSEGFIEFLAEFANDSIFQVARVNDPLTFVTADPDDDFSVIETSLDLNQWFAFKPELPTEKLSNINYGQQQSANSNKKILALKGIGNGFSNILYFRRKPSLGYWELYKFEDVSI